MAAAASSPEADSHTPLTLLFSMQARITGEPLLSIKGIDNLSLDDELHALETPSICTPQSRKQVTASLFAKVPELRESSDLRNRFEEALSAYAQSMQNMLSVAPAAWTKEQLSLSLFMYWVQQHRRTPVDERDTKWLTSALKFIDFLLRLCIDECFDGAQMLALWNEQTSNGTSVGSFQVLTYKICAHQNEPPLSGPLDLEFRNKIRLETWYTSSLYDFEWCIRSFVTEHDIDSTKLASMSTREIGDLLERHKRKYTFVYRLSVTGLTPSALRDAFLEGALLTWSHVVAAVRHEMYPLMAAMLQESVACVKESVKEFDFRAESVETVIKALKSKKSGVSVDEEQYIKRLVGRATAYRRTPRTVGFQIS